MQEKISNKTPVVVELYGLPGSGKSTLGRRLQERYRGRVCLVDRMSRGARLWYALGFIFRFPRASWVWFVCWWRLGDPRLRRYEFHLLISSWAKMMRASLLSCDFVLVDEGLHQRLFTIVAGEIGARDLRCCLTVIPLTTYVLVSSGGGFARFIQAPDRDQSPRHKLGKVYLDSWRERLVLLDQQFRQEFWHQNQNRKYLFLPAVSPDRLDEQVDFISEQLNLK